VDQLILELKEAFHMTIIVVTHELASAFLIADRMVLIDKGNVVAIGSTEECVRARIRACGSFSTASPSRQFRKNWIICKC